MRVDLAPYLAVDPCKELPVESVENINRPYRFFLSHQVDLPFRALTFHAEDKQAPDGWLILLSDKMQSRQERNSSSNRSFQSFHRKGQ